MEHIQEKQPPNVIASDTDNHTQIRPDEAPPDKRAKFERFRAYNTGLWNGPRRENKELMHRQDDLHLYDAISSQLELTPHQVDRGRRFLDQISVGDYTSQGRPTRAVIFALCAAIANSECRDGTRYWPHPDTQSNSADFDRVAESIGTDWRDMVSLIMKIGHRLEG